MMISYYAARANLYHVWQHHPNWTHAEFAAALSWATVPDAIRAKVADHILDTIGVMCAGVATAQRAALLAAGQAHPLAGQLVHQVARKAWAEVRSRAQQYSQSVKSRCSSRSASSW